MLPLPVSPGSLETFIIEGEKISRDNFKQAYTAYFAELGSTAVISKRKRVPSRVALYNAKVLIDSVDHVRITIVRVRPSDDHCTDFITA
jgi:hypothetical protein